MINKYCHPEPVERQKFYDSTVELLALELREAQTDIDINTKMLFKKIK